MVRKIEQRLFCIKTYNGNRHYIESDSIDELAVYVADLSKNGYVVTSVTEICNDGSTPKVPIMSSKAYKQAIK